jgi:hypothetical protein
MGGDRGRKWRRAGDRGGEGRHTDSRHGGERETVALRMGAGATPRSTSQADRHRRRRRLWRAQGELRAGRTGAKAQSDTALLDNGEIWVPWGSPRPWRDLGAAGNERLCAVGAVEATRRWEGR